MTMTFILFDSVLVAECPAIAILSNFTLNSVMLMPGETAEHVESGSSALNYYQWGLYHGVAFLP